MSQIVIAEDDAPIRDFLKEFLIAKGFTVATFESGKGVLEYVKTHDDVEVILSDVRMPEISGLSLLDSIVREIPDPPIFLLMTGFAGCDVEQAIARGALNVLSKPIDPDDILGLMVQLIHKKA